MSDSAGSLDPTPTPEKENVMTARMFDYEVKVWNRGAHDWAWKVRTEGLFSNPFASGRSDTRAEAKRAALCAIELHEREAETPWKSVDG